MSKITINKAVSFVDLDTDSNAGTGILRDGNGNAETNNFTANNSLITLGTYVGSVVTLTSSTTLGANTHIIADATSGAFTLTMPTTLSLPSLTAGQEYNVFKKDNANAVTLSGTTGITSLTTGMQNTWHKIVYDGTNWYCG